MKQQSEQNKNLNRKNEQPQTTLNNGKTSEKQQFWNTKQHNLKQKLQSGQKETKLDKQYNSEQQQQFEQKKL